MQSQPCSLFAVVALLTAACQAQAPWKKIQFHRGAPAELKAKRVTHADGSASNLIWLDFGGGKGGWALLDTGASVAVLDKTFADSLGTAPLRSLSVNGQPATLRQTAQVAIGRLLVSGPLFVAVDLAPLVAQRGSGFRPEDPLVGIVGYSMLQSVILRIEYGEAADRVFLYEPNSFQLPGTEKWQPSKLVDRSPAIPAEVAGTKGLFKLDTGKTFTMSLVRPFVEANKLDAGVSTTVEENRRIEGSVPERVGVLSNVQFGGHTFSKPRVSFRMTKEETASELAGVIGREFLKVFRLTFDYANERIAIAPR